MLQHNLQWRVIKGMHNHVDVNLIQTHQLHLRSLLATQQKVIVPLIIDVNAALILVKVGIPCELMREYLSPNLYSELEIATRQAWLSQGESRQVNFILSQPALTAQLYQLAVGKFFCEDLQLKNLENIEVYDLSELMQGVVLDTKNIANLDADNQHQLLQLVLQYRKALWLDSPQAQAYAQALANLKLTQEQQFTLLMHALEQVRERSLQLGRIYKAKVTNIDTSLNSAFVEIGPQNIPAILRFADLSDEFKQEFAKIKPTKQQGNKKRGDVKGSGEISNYLNRGQNIHVQVKSLAYDDKLARVVACLNHDSNETEATDQELDLRAWEFNRESDAYEQANASQELECNQYLTDFSGAASWAFPWYFTNNPDLWGGNPLTQYQLSSSRILYLLDLLAEHVQYLHTKPLCMLGGNERTILPARTTSGPAQWQGVWGNEYTAVISRLGMVVDVDYANFAASNCSNTLLRKYRDTFESTEGFLKEKIVEAMRKNAVDYDCLDPIITKIGGGHADLLNELAESRNKEVLLNLIAVIDTIQHAMRANYAGQVVIDLVNLNRNQQAIFNEVMENVLEWIKLYASSLADSSLAAYQHLYLARYLARVTINAQEGSVKAFSKGKEPTKKAYVKQFFTRNGLLEINIAREGVSLSEALVQIQENLVAMRKQESSKIPTLMKYNVVQQLMVDNAARLVAHNQRVIAPEIERQMKKGTKLQGMSFESWVQQSRSDLLDEQNEHEENDSDDYLEHKLDANKVHPELMQLMRYEEYTKRISNNLSFVPSKLYNEICMLEQRLNDYEVSLEQDHTNNYMRGINTTSCYLQLARYINNNNEQVYQQDDVRYEFAQLNMLSVYAG